MEVGINARAAIFRPFQREKQSITIKFIFSLLYDHFFPVCLNWYLTIGAKTHKLNVKYKLNYSVV